MEEKLRDHLREAGVINGILMICVLIAQLLGIGAFEHGIMDSAAMICALLAYASGICYTFKGYEKRAANFYKLFMLLYALSAVCTAAVALEATPSARASTRRERPTRDSVMVRIASVAPSMAVHSPSVS